MKANCNILVISIVQDFSFFFLAIFLTCSFIFFCDYLFGFCEYCFATSLSKRKIQILDILFLLCISNKMLLWNVWEQYNQNHSIKVGTMFKMCHIIKIKLSVRNNSVLATFLAVIILSLTYPKNLPSTSPISSHKPTLKLFHVTENKSRILLKIEALPTQIVTGTQLGVTRT